MKISGRLALAMVLLVVVTSCIEVHSPIISLLKLLRVRC